MIFSFFKILSLVNTFGFVSGNLFKCLYTGLQYVFLCNISLCSNVPRDKRPANTYPSGNS